MTIVMAVLVGLGVTALYDLLTAPENTRLKAEGDKRRRESGYYK